MWRSGLVMGFWLIVAVIPNRVAGADVSKMALVTIEIEAEVAAGPDQVWSALTRANLARRWYPGWSDLDPRAPEMTSVGRSVHFIDEYGNAGESVVLYVVPREEIRIAHVPRDGSYLCQTTITLDRVGRKTVVRVKEQYSDQLHVPVDRGTATMTRDLLATALTALKSLVE